MSKRFRPVSAALVVTLLGASLAAAGCGQYSFSALKAKKNYREANDLYKASNWREAAEHYEVAATSDPTLPGVFFFLGNSYDNLYKPSRAGEEQNDDYLQKAIKNYRIAAERDPEPIMRQRAMEYLVAAYGPDKLNQPAEAEPIVKRMIDEHPNEPTNYFALAKIYEDAGRYEDAEATLMRAKEAKPNDPVVYTTISGFYNRQGEFDKTMEALRQAADLDPQNPQGYHLVATYYQEKVQKDYKLKPAQAKEYVLAGIQAEDKALSLNADYVDAMIYKNILLRHQARLETDRKVQEQLLKDADRLRDKAMELNKKKASGLP
jgi:tetratricopeptide (TPR) repeat protein